MSLVARLSPNGPSGFGYGSTAEDVTRGLSLEGKTFLVTGCNSGIGEESLRVLALRGARVIGTARTVEKAEAACTSVGKNSIPLACELSDPKSVRACVAAIADRGVRLDGIIANAGVMALPRLETSFGVELQFFTNHVGHFILVTALIDRLTPEGRVVMVSSDAHKRAPRGGIMFDNLDGSKGYSPWSFYGQSKIANILFANELSRRFAGTKRTANAVHPGVIKTNLDRHSNAVVRLFYKYGGPIGIKDVAQGAATQVFVATHPSLAGVTGQYFANSNVARARRDGTDAGTAARLWDVTERIVADLPR